jgi:energy-coupling factor transport system ATP-binding protein
MSQTPFEAVALKDASFDLAQGEAVGLVGQVGSGKSTLGQVLSGLLTPDSGELLVKGKVSFLFQKPEKQLFEANVFDEVAFGPRNLRLGEKEVRQSVVSALSVVGLDFDIYKGRSPFELSGGEMRLVAIASVLALRSPALIMDEPTAGLDFFGKRRVLDFLKELKNEKKSIVLISHDLEEVLDVCDRVVVLDKGQVVLKADVGSIAEHVDFLNELGLFLPEEHTLAIKLKKCGYPVEGFDRESIKKAIEARLSGK